METSESVRETARETSHGAAAHEPELATHPGPREYVKIAVILALATAAEVALYYITNMPRALNVGLLMFFMIVKFAFVVLWFMHLRFDARIFRRLFVTGLLLAVSVYLVVLVIFGVFVRD